MRFENLTTECRNRGYHGISIEACEEIDEILSRDPDELGSVVRLEYREFIAGMRALMLPADPVNRGAL